MFRGGRKIDNKEEEEEYENDRTFKFKGIICYETGDRPLVK